MKRSIIFIFVLILGLSSAWADDWTSWTPPGAPCARQGHSMVSLGDGYVLLFGGEGEEGLFNDLYAFNTDSWDWNEITPNNTPPPARRDHQAWARPDGMYIYGGCGENGALDDMWNYDPEANTWQQVQISGPRPTARYGHTSNTMADGSVLIFGGTDADGDPMKDFWKLNTDNTFTQFADASDAYTEHCTELVGNDDLLLVFGIPGIVSLYQFSASMWGATSGGPPLSGSANSCQGVNAAGDPVIFFFGGKDADGNENAEVYEYNLTNGETTLRGPMPQPIVNGAKAQLPVVPPSKQQFGNNWLVFGGLSDSIPTNNTYGFTPISPPDTITLVTPMDSVFADSVMMIWNPAEPWQATHYQLQVACDSAMTIFLADTIVTDTSYLVKELINNTDYWWQVRGYNAGGWGPYNNPVHFLVNFVVSIDDDPHQNSTLALTTSPNPFNDHISISFSLQEPQQVTCSLYNMKGEKIQTLFSGQSPVGFNEHEKNIVNLRSGVYLIKLQSQNSEEIQKIIHF